MFVDSTLDLEISLPFLQCTIQGPSEHISMHLTHKISIKQKNSTQQLGGNWQPEKDWDTGENRQEQNRTSRCRYLGCSVSGCPLLISLWFQLTSNHTKLYSNEVPAFIKSLRVIIYLRSFRFYPQWPLYLVCPKAGNNLRTKELLQDLHHLGQSEQKNKIKLNKYRWLQINPPFQNGSHCSE